MSSNVEEILLKLLVPDNKILQEATTELREVFKSPNLIQTLVDLLATSSTVQVRQYSAILLRRKISKIRQWNKLSVNIKNCLKESLLRLVVSETEKSVKNSIAQVIGIVGKHELSKNQWPALLEFLNRLIISSNESDRQLGMFTLNIVAEAAALQLKPHFLGLISLFSKTLQDSNEFVVTHTIYLMNFGPLCGHRPHKTSFPTSASVI